MSEENKTWNVPQMEERLNFLLMNTAHVREDGSHPTLDVLANALKDKHGKEMKEAVLELAAICRNTEDNPTEYHLNVIHSGRTEYMLYIDSEDAERNCDAYGPFKSMEEAEAKEEEVGCGGTIIGHDPNEWWAILDKNNKNVTMMLYPYKLRALAFLYHLATPPKFRAYLEAGDVILGVEVHAN